MENIGHTHYVNICTGKELDVPWGTMAYLWLPLFVVVIVIIAAWSYRALEPPRR